MARIVIREQDLTGNRVNQDFTDIAFIPGFVKYPKEDYTTPQLCYTEEEFIDKFGNEPAITNSRFTYNVTFEDEPVLNPETGNTAFYIDAKDIESVSDSAYHYARELLYRGLPIYYCPMNQRKQTSKEATNAFVCACDDTDGSKKGQMISYDGNQNAESAKEPVYLEDEDNTKATLRILHKGSSESPVIIKQGAANKIKVDPKADPGLKVISKDEEQFYGLKDQTVDYSSVATFTIQVEGTNVEKFMYKWYIEDSDLEKQLISTSQICNISALTFADPDEDKEYTVSVEVSAIPTNAALLEDINIVQEGEPLTMKQILAISRAKAIEEARALTHNKFAQEMLDFFNDTDNTELIKDRGLYNFKYMTTGGYPLFDAAELPNDGTASELKNWEKALTNLLEVCGQKTVDDSKDYIAEDGSTQRQGRGDCILLIDHTLDKCQDTMDLYHRARQWFEDPSNVNNETLEFAAMFTPWCNYNMTYTSHTVDVDLPASFAYLSCLADSIQAYDNWHAISGVTRGTVKNINEILLTNPLTNTKANKCQADPETAERDRISINCITEIKPYGQVIWGNRTLQKADAYKHVTAMGFLNLRNEVSDIKKLVYRAARRWMFEQNTSVLWVNFKSTITPLLERMVNGYGLSRYEIRKGAKTAKHKLYAEIRIWPIYAVEYIDVTIQILDEETIVTEE